MNVKVTALIHGGTVQFEMQYPSDEQWKARQAKRVIVQTDLGRGQTDTKVIYCDDFDLETIKGLAKDLPAGFGAAAAAKVMDHLAQAEVVRVEKIGAAYAVEIAGGAGYAANIELKVPTPEALLAFERSNYRVVSSGKHRRISPNLSAGEDLYAAMEGPDGVPVLHKFAAVQSVVEDLNSLTAPEDFR